MAQASKVAVAVLKTNPLLPELSFLRLRKYLQNPRGNLRSVKSSAKTAFMPLKHWCALRQAEIFLSRLLFPTIVPPENFMQAIAEVLSSKRIEESTGSRPCLSLMNEIR